MAQAERREDESRRGPWPGPRPYREADRGAFFGREDDLYTLLQRLDAEQLMLLTAPSAVGKTSFLRAAVVPELRRRRALAARTGRRNEPAVLVVRDWSPDLTDTHSFDSFFIEAIQEGIRDLAEEAESYEPEVKASITRDHELFSAISTDSTAYAYVDALARASGGLTLILDQFEEALQGSKVHVVRIAQLIGSLFKKQPDVRLLLSFREEFLTRFTPISRQVGDLVKRQYYLHPLEPNTVRDALLESASAGGVDLSVEALDELWRWLEESEERATKEKRAPGYQRNAEDVINLLKLQAVLLQIYRTASADHPSGRVQISLETLGHLRAGIDGEGDAVNGAEIIERALQRFIDSLLPLPTSITDASGLPQGAPDQEELMHLIRHRRAAARMGPMFSSGGFKVAQEQSDLFARAWREEWEVLDITIEEVQEALEDAGELEPDHVYVFREENPDVDVEMPPEITVLSGIARTDGWSIAAVADDLIDTSLHALKILVEGNVLREKLVQGSVTYELVHDGFGDALSDWSEEARDQAIDALCATTAERGTAFRWVRLSGYVRDICWLGCWVGPDRDRKKRLLIENVTFDHCDLRGTVFDRCDFVGGEFRNCDLGGVVFWDCTFEGAAAQPFLFDTVDASGLSFDDQSELRHVRFSGKSRLHNMSWNNVRLNDVVVDNCVVNQLTVGQVELSGPLVIARSWVLLSDLVGLQTTGETPVSQLIEITDCDLFYCRLDHATGTAADSDPTNQRYPDPRLIGQEPEFSNPPPADFDPWRQPA